MLFSDIILLLQFAFHCKSIYQKRNVWHLVSDDLECSRFIKIFLQKITTITSQAFNENSPQFSEQKEDTSLLDILNK